MISFGALFSRPDPALLGVDISPSSAKLVELSLNAEGGMVLERCAMEPLQAGWMSDGNIDKFDEISLALQRLVRKSGTATRNVVMALPTSAVISKKVVLATGLSDDELALQVELEAAQYIPFPLDEVSLDFYVMGPSGTSGDDVEVLIAASRKEKVQDRVGLAEAAGLKAVILDVESYAANLAACRLIRNLPNGGKDAVVALVQVGSLTTTLQVIRNGEVLYERDQSFGGAQLTQLIVRHYGFSQEEAELRKLRGDLPEDYPGQVLRTFVESLAQEINRALQFFFTSTPHHKVDYVMLSGGSASVPGLPRAVTEQTSFLCRLANPFEGMQISQGVRDKKTRQDAASYLTACGLAMRRFLR